MFIVFYYIIGCHLEFPVFYWGGGGAEDNDHMITKRQEIEDRK